MALTVDEYARREIARRQQRGREATMLVRVARGGLQEYVTVGWAERQGGVQDLAPRVDGVPVLMDARVAAYTRGHPLTISARRWGPFAQLLVRDEPRVLLELQEWEQRVWYATKRRTA